MKRLALCLVAIAVSPALALAQEGKGFRVTRLADDIASSTQDVASLVIDADGARLETAGGPAAEGDLLSVERLAGEIYTDTFHNVAPHRMILRDGEVLRGRLIAADDVEMQFAALFIGAMTIPLENVAAVADHQVPLAQVTGESPVSDVVELRNGDRVTGFFSGLTPEGFAVDAEAGGQVTLDPETVRVLLLADVGGATTRPAEGEAHARVALVGGVLLLADEVEVAGRQLRVKRGEMTYNGDVEQLVAVEPLDAPVAWLADGTPTEATHVPYLSAQSPPRVTGGLIGGGVGDAALPVRTIELRPRGRVSFDVPPGDWSRLRATISNGDVTAGRASADVRVLLDGEVAFERDALTSADGEVDIDVPLEGAATITFEADYGEFLDVEDHIVLGGAAVLR